MESFLKRPRSIVGALLWGALGALATFVALLIADFAYSFYFDRFGPPHLVESVAVGGGYSITMKAQPIHLFLAEYEQEVSIYGGESRSGGLLGTVRIPMNTGGRVRIGVLVPTDPERHDVVLLDRYATSRIDLSTRTVRPETAPVAGSDLRALGLFSGESYPLKFIPCAVWSRLSPKEQDAVLGHEAELKEFCEIGNDAT